MSVIVLTFFSCDNNDDATSAASTDGFTINSTFHETVNAIYLLINQTIMQMVILITIILCLQMVESRILLEM